MSKPSIDFEKHLFPKRLSGRQIKNNKEKEAASFKNLKLSLNYINLFCSLHLQQLLLKTCRIKDTLMQIWKSANIFEFI